MNDIIHFPALVIGKSSVDTINYRYLVADKRFLDFAFKDVLIIDNDGQCFDVKEVVQAGKVDWFYSIKLIGLIIPVKPILAGPVKKISLSDLKNLIALAIKKNPQRFSSISDSNILISEVMECLTYTEIMKLF